MRWFLMMPPILAVALMGCATHTQIAAGKAMTALQEAGAKSEACFEAIIAHAEVAVLKPAGGLPSKDSPTLAQLSDLRRATDQEIEALLKLDAMKRPCRQIALEAFQQNASLYVPIHIKRYTESDTVAAELIQKKITWGEAHQKWQVVNTAYRMESSQMDAYYRQQIAQSHQAEMQQRQQVAQAMQQWSQNQQMVNAVNRPRNTNCNYFGNQIQCTTF